MNFKRKSSIYNCLFRLLGNLHAHIGYCILWKQLCPSDLIILYPVFLSELYGYVWFPENLRENARERKYKGKVEGKKK